MDLDLPPQTLAALRDVFYTGHAAGAVFPESWRETVEAIAAAEPEDRLGPCLALCKDIGLTAEQFLGEALGQDGGVEYGPEAFVRPWPTLSPAALQGNVGALVNEIAPHTEADPAALLANHLVMLGNCVGRDVYYYADGSRHACNLFMVTVGKSQSGKKGTATSNVARVYMRADQLFEVRLKTGLSSGEGLVHAVRDRREGVKTKDGVETPVVLDEGSDTKEIIALEEELSAVLGNMAREGNNLSALLRKAWDGRLLEFMVKGMPERASNAHISSIMHSTPEDLSILTDLDKANGFGNRFLWPLTRRQRHISISRSRPDVESLAGLVQGAVAFGRGRGEMRFDADAEGLWESHYRRLTEDGPGVVGKLSGRAAPQICRLSCVYALADCSKMIRPEHLQAGRAFWDYCLDSLYFLFGDDTGNAKTDTILRVLRESPHGLSKAEVCAAVPKTPPAMVERSLRDLAGYRLAEDVSVGSSSGRGRDIWRAVAVNKTGRG